MRFLIEQGLQRLFVGFRRNPDLVLFNIWGLKMRFDHSPCSSPAYSPVATSSIWWLLKIKSIFGGQGLAIWKELLKLCWVTNIRNDFNLTQTSHM